MEAEVDIEFSRLDEEDNKWIRWLVFIAFSASSNEFVRRRLHKRAEKKFGIYVAELISLIVRRY
jgi:hypothetical protein